MTHAFGGGGDLTLATLWVPVQPETRGLHEEFVKVGEEARRGFSEGFERHGSGMMGNIVGAMALGFQRSMPAGFSQAFGELHSQFEHMGSSALTAQMAFDRYTNSMRLTGDAANRVHTEETKGLNIRNQASNVAAQMAVSEALIAEHRSKGTASSEECQKEEENLQNLRVKGNDLAVQSVAAEGRIDNAQAMHAQRLQESTTAHERYNETLEQTHRHLNLSAIGHAAMTGAVMGLTFATVNLVGEGLSGMVHGLEDVVKAGAAAVESVVSIGQEFQDLNRKVQLYTTDSGVEAERIQDSMRNVYANLLDVPPKHLAEIGSVLHQQFGLVGQDLEKLTGHLTEMEKRFGSLPVRDFAAAMHQFGIEGGPALDKALGQLIYDAQQFGITVPALMSDMINTGPIFDALGVPFNSAALAVSKITQLGDPARRVMLGLSQTAKEMAKGPDSEGTFKRYVEDVLKTGEELQKSGGEKLADAFALEEFGARNWAILQQTAQPVLDAINRVGEAGNNMDITKLITDTQILHEQWTRFMLDVKARIAPLGLDIVRHLWWWPGDC